jgi:ketosteroid isomerase-like protein
MPVIELPPHSVEWPVWSGINDQLQAYADAIDRGDIAAILAIFTPDAVWDYAPGATRTGHDEMRAFFTERFSVFATTSHHVGPPVVRADPADGSYHSTSYLMSQHLLRDGQSYTGYGRYVDRFRLVDGRFLIARRKVIGHVMQGIARRVYQLERVPQ